MLGFFKLGGGGFRARVLLDQVGRITDRDALTQCGDRVRGRDRRLQEQRESRDAVVIDLEDAVAPEAKTAAADMLRRAWPTLDAGRIAIRINAAGTPWHEDNLALCRALQPAAVMWPKAEEPARTEQAMSLAVGAFHRRARFSAQGNS